MSIQISTIKSFKFMLEREISKTKNFLLFCEIRTLKAFEKGNTIHL